MSSSIVTSVTNFNEASTANIALTITGTVNVGDVIAVFINSYLGLLDGSVSDNKSNTYGNAIAIDQTTLGNAVTAKLAIVTTGGSDVVVTVNPGTNTYTTAAAVVIRGLNTSSLVVATVADDGTADPPSLNIATTGNARIIGAFANVNADSTITPGSGYTQVVEDEGAGAHNSLAVETKTVSVDNTYTVDWTVGTPQTWGIVGYALREASAGTVKRNNLALMGMGR